MVTATGSLGRQWQREQLQREGKTIPGSAARARASIAQSRQARAAGDPAAAALHLQSAAAHRHDAMELAGLPFTGLQRPNHFSGGNILGNGIKKTRRLP